MKRVLLIGGSHDAEVINIEFGNEIIMPKIKEISFDIGISGEVMEDDREVYKIDVFTFAEGEPIFFAFLLGERLSERAFLMHLCNRYEKLNVPKQEGE